MVNYDIYSYIIQQIDSPNLFKLRLVSKEFNQIVMCELGRREDNFITICRQKYLQTVIIFITDLMRVYNRHNFQYYSSESIDHILDTVLSFGCDPCWQDDKSLGKTLLMLLCKYSRWLNCDKYIKQIIDKGYNVNHNDNTGKTSLMYAVSGNTSTETTVKMLIEKGSNIDHRDGDGRTALMFAVSNKETPINIIKILIDAKANLEIKSDSGYTVLQLAVYHGDESWETEERIRLLINSGCKLDITGRLGWKTLMINHQEKERNRYANYR